MIDYSNDAIVDAIEEGKIVRVSEEYARREGLLILRKNPHIPQQELSPKDKKEEEARKNKGFIGMDDLRKPLKSQRTEVMNEMVENFHWILIQRRKAKGITRKKLADEVGESETNIKMIENGVLPMNNFILVNKLESYYGVSLRKNKVASAQKTELRQPIDFGKRIAERKAAVGGKKEGEKEIEIVEGEGKGKEGEIDIIELEKY